LISVVDNGPVVFVSPVAVAAFLLEPPPIFHQFVPDNLRK
jgi:hypothetical protein